MSVKNCYENHSRWYSLFRKALSSRTNVVSSLNRYPRSKVFHSDPQSTTATGGTVLIWTTAQRDGKQPWNSSWPLWWNVHHVWATRLDVYKHSGSRQDRYTLLKLYNGSSWAHTFRSVSARVPRTAFNMSGFIQPGLLLEQLQKADVDGFNDRQLFDCPAGCP